MAKRIIVLILYSIVGLDPLWAAYRISFERFTASGVGPEDPRSRRQDRYILTLYPILGDRNIYEGIQVPFSPSHPERQNFDIAYAQIMSQVWLQAYEKIAVDKGLFKIGDPFHKQLIESEHPYDGRSALIAIFEGANLGNPLSTLRVSSPVNIKGRGVLHAPLVERITKLPEASEELRRKLRHMHTEVREATEAHVEYLDLKQAFMRLSLDVYLDFAQQTHPETLFNANDPEIARHVEALRAFGNGNPSGADIGRLFETQIAFAGLLEYARKKTSGREGYALPIFLKDAAKKLGLNIDFTKGAKLSVPFAELEIEYAKSWAHGHIGKKIGGPPIEMKGLTHVETADGMDSMWMLFFKAEMAGFWDRIWLPFRGDLMPELIVAETATAFIPKFYEKWGWTVQDDLKYFDRALNQEVSVVHMDRQQLARLMFSLFSRYVPWSSDATSFRNVEFPDASLSAEEINRRRGEMMKSDYDIFRKDKGFAYSGLPLSVIQDWICETAYSGTAATARN